MKHISIYSSARYAASRMQSHITWGQMEGIQIALPQTSQSSVELRTGRSAERASVTNKSDDDTSVDKSCRYILGKPSKMGDNIIVIAANPSKAGLVKTDSTMDNIVKTVNHLGAKGYTVLNLCLFGVAIPISCQLRPTKLVMDENMRAFADVLAKPYMKDAKVWAA